MSERNFFESQSNLPKVMRGNFDDAEDDPNVEKQNLEIEDEVEESLVEDEEDNDGLIDDISWKKNILPVDSNQNLENNSTKTTELPLDRQELEKK